MATNTKGTLKYRKIQRTPQTGENAGKKKWYATASAVMFGIVFAFLSIP